MAGRQGIAGCEGAGNEIKTNLQIGVTFVRFLKKFRSVFGLGRPVSDSPAHAEDEWDIFKRYKDDSYWLLVVNKGLLKNNQIISMSWFSIEYRFLQRHLVNRLFPRPDLSNLYYGFEDHLSQKLSAIGGVVAATQTGFGSRIVWFCAPSLLLEDILRTEAKGFDSFTLDISPSSYKQFEEMLPTDLENQFAGNAKILQNMANHGDDGSAVREVMHWIYGQEQENLRSLASKVEDEGYTIQEVDDKKLRFSKMTSLDEDQSRFETIRLSELCRQFDCEYDGWETPIVKRTVH
jgi:regulator of RNase E activity RraB